MHVYGRDILVNRSWSTYLFNIINTYIPFNDDTWLKIEDLGESSISDGALVPSYDYILSTATYLLVFPCEVHMFPSEMVSFSGCVASVRKIIFMVIFYSEYANFYIAV